MTRLGSRSLILESVGNCGTAGSLRQDPAGRRRVPAVGLPRPSIHMPRWASRLHLEVTDVRVERVQDTSYRDMVDEGYPGPPRYHDTEAQGALLDW